MPTASVPKKSSQRKSSQRPKPSLATQARIEARRRLAKGGDSLVVAVLRRDKPRLAEFLQACSIEDKETGALIPFILWRAQLEIVAEFQAAIDSGDWSAVERKIILKARQLGLTWLILGILLYLGTFWGHRLFLVVSQSGDDSQSAMQRLNLMRDSLPECWRQPIVRDNTTEIAFANGSRYEAGKATKRYGRSKAAFAALLDEVAFWEWPEEQMAALWAACKIMIVVTTSDGPGDYVHKIWQNAGAGKGRWRRTFLPWTACPNRDAEWYRLNVLEAEEPRRALREFAATPEEAFSAPEGVFFERFLRERNTDDISPVSGWRTERAVDFGYRHPACVWIQTAPSGQPFVVAELVPSDTTTDEFAAAIKRVDVALGVRPHVTYCDPAGNAANVQTAKSEVETLREYGLNPISRASSIRDGCVRIMSALADQALPLVVSRSCPWLIEALSTVRPDKHRPDLYDEGSDYTHVLDALRYWAVNNAVASAPQSSKVTGGRRITAGLVGMRF